MAKSKDFEFDILDNEDIELEINGTFTPNELHGCITRGIDLHEELKIPVRVRLRTFDHVTVSKKEEEDE